MTTELNAHQLARMADCASPDNHTSPGAAFLSIVAESVDEAVRYDRLDEDVADIAHEIANGCVPVYTHTVWATFVDLCAWQENPRELGFELGDGFEGSMERAAMICLYVIGERLALTLLEEATEEVAVAACPACGQPIDYCQGHGDIGDPEGASVLAQHDDDNHTDCHPEGCEEAAS